MATKETPKTKSLQCAAYKRPTLGQMAHINWKWGDGKGYFMQTEMIRKWKVAILASVKTDFKTKAIKKDTRGLPWQLSGKESACQFKRQRFNPWSRKIPHAAEQLSLCATTSEPARHNFWACMQQPLKPAGCALWQVRAPQGEAHALQPEKSPHSREDPAQAKTNNIFKSTLLLSCFSGVRLCATP